MSQAKQRIVVAMSGGVDSTVTAALLQEQGHEVIGLTMRIWDHPSVVGDAEPMADARRMAERLGIAWHLMDVREAFRQRVVQPFCEEYFSGQTPNPCVLCNRLFKFRLLLDEADRLGGDALATGHYARILGGGDDCRLVKGSHAHKDQSYFLFVLPRQQLSRVRFPLGEMEKSQVRAKAAALGLAVADKGDSQDICFIPDQDYAGFLERECPERCRPGAIVHVSGRVVGKHAGTYRFTVGQRRGLGIAWPAPLYVVAIDAQRRQVVVGEKRHLEVSSLMATEVNWLIPEPALPVRAACRIRYRHREAPATLVPLGGGRVEVRFDQVQTGVSPGQAAVFYDGDQVLGGGRIA